jgi:two-component system, sensor histidine kinase PdtaS
MAHALTQIGATPPAGFGSASPERLSAVLREREQAQSSIREVELRSEIAREQRLLQEKDALIRQQEILGRESDHRLLNNLQMVVSLLSLQSRTEANAAAASHLAIAANRVATIARIHRHLHSMDGLQTVALKRYLDELCRDYSQMLISTDREAQPIVVDGTEMNVPTEVGFPLGLIVNELVTNAIKYGKGAISVTLEPQAGRAALSVCNHGSVLPDDFDPAASKGLGMSLVWSLVEQIGGELQVDRGEDNDSTRFTVLFPR